MRTGNIWTVMIYDYKTAKDLMSRAELADRPPFFEAFTLNPEEHGGEANFMTQFSTRS